MSTIKHLLSVLTPLSVIMVRRSRKDCLRDKAVADDLERVFAQKRAAIYGGELVKEAIA